MRNTEIRTYNISGRIEGVKLPKNVADISNKYMKECPKCEKRRFIVSIFGSICDHCGYTGESKK